jgi:hypothetical protein
MEQDPAHTGLNGSGTAVTVRELLLEVRGDLRSHAAKNSSFEEEVRALIVDSRLTHARFDKQFADISEELDRAKSGLKECEDAILTRESQLGFVRGVFGPTLLPALLSSANILILLFVLARSIGLS